LRRTAAAALVTLLLTGCGGDDGSSARADRIFAVADIHVADEGGLLLVGTATRGDWDSEDDDYCDGDGSATRDLAILELTSDGRLEGTHALDEDDLDGCAVEIRRTSMDQGRLLVEAVVRESPGLIPGEGGPESREHDYATRFDPAADEFENTRSEERPGYAKVAYAEVAIPGGDIVTIEEDPARERRTEEGFYTGTISLIRRSEGGAPAWSRPVRAISPDVDTHDVLWEGGRGWELFVDSRGIYGFAWYSTWSGDNEVVLFRHGLDGLPDASFGDGGRVLVHAPWFHGAKRTIRLADRDFVVAGAAGDEEPGRILLRRFSPDGEPRRAFDRAAARAVSCGPPVALAVRSGGGLFIACSRGGRAVVHALGDDGRPLGGFGEAGKAVIDRV
jgi:hypothetical protein